MNVILFIQMLNKFFRLKNARHHFKVVRFRTLMKRLHKADIGIFFLCSPFCGWKLFLLSFARVWLCVDESNQVFQHCFEGLNGKICLKPSFVEKNKQQQSVRGNITFFATLKAVKNFWIN